MSPRFIMTIAALTLFGIRSHPATAQQISVHTDAVRFDRLAQAPAVPIPDSQRAFPGTNCGSGDRGPTGMGAMVVIPFNTNRLTITGAQGNLLCIFDGGTMIFSVSGGLENTQPNFMTANTIVGNDQKDLRFVFDRPVRAVGFRLLTNNVAQEVAEFKDVGGNTYASINIDRFTPRNDRVFVGFTSRRPIKELVLRINRGIPPAGQNEGIEAIKVSDTLTATASATDELSPEEAESLAP